MSSVQCRKFIKISICFLIIAALGFGFVRKPETYFPSAEAASISDMQNQINGYENQKSELKSKINALQGDIDKQQEYLDTLNSYISAVESKIVTCESILASYESEVKNLNKEIGKKEKELDENKELFKRRIRSVHMSGTNSSLLLLLGGDYFADYLSMSQFTESLAKYDNALMQKIDNAMDDINKKIEKKNEAIDKQNGIKEELASERADWQSKKNEASKIYNSINADKKDLQSQIDELDRNIAALEALIAQAYEDAKNDAGNIQYDGKGFAWPLPGYSTITSYFGMRYDPYYHVYRGHNGIDISGASVFGKPIVASASGKVSSTIHTASSGGYGEYVILNHGYINGSLVTTHYAHMTYFVVSPGQSVKQGQVIGYVGSTGASTGAHLHFEVRVNNTPVNPLGYVKP